MLDEAKAGIKIARRNISNLRYADDTILMAESKEELKCSWWRWKRRVKKGGLKLNIQKATIMVSSHYFMANRWGNIGNSDRLLGSKSLWMVTAAMKLKDTCSLEGKLWQTLVSSVIQSCPILCNPMDCKVCQASLSIANSRSLLKLMSMQPRGLQSVPGFPVHHQLPEFTQTHVHQVGDAIHPLSSPSPPAINLSQNQGLF